MNYTGLDLHETIYRATKGITDEDYYMKGIAPSRECTRLAAHINRARRDVERSLDKIEKLFERLDVISH